MDPIVNQVKHCGGDDIVYVVVVKPPCETTAHPSSENFLYLTPITFPKGSLQRGSFPMGDPFQEGSPADTTRYGGLLVVYATR